MDQLGQVVGRYAVCPAVEWHAPFESQQRMAAGAEIFGAIHPSSATLSSSVAVCSTNRVPSWSTNWQSLRGPVKIKFHNGRGSRV
jgi:hypothetical protein